MKNREPLTPLMSHQEILKALGQRCRSCRDRMQLSRKELAKKSGVSEPTISRFETNGVATVSVMVKLARSLGVIETLDGIFSVPKYQSLEEFVKAES